MEANETPTESTELEAERTKLRELEAELALAEQEAETLSRRELAWRAAKRDLKSGAAVVEVDGETVVSTTCETKPLPVGIDLEVTDDEEIRIKSRWGRGAGVGTDDDEVRFFTALSLFRTQGAPTAASKTSRSVPELMAYLEAGVAEFGPGDGPWPACTPDRAAGLRGVYERAVALGVSQLAASKGKPVEAVLAFINEGAMLGLFEWPPSRDTASQLIQGGA